MCDPALSLNLTLPQMHLLLMLSTIGPSPLGRSKCSMAEIRQIEDAGFVTVERTPDQTTLRLTDEGERFIAIT